MQCTVNYPISVNIDKVLTDLTVHHKNWFNYPGETDKLSELLPCVTILRLFTLKLRSLTGMLTVLFFRTLILPIVVQWYFLHCRHVIVSLSQFPLMLALCWKRFQYNCWTFGYYCVNWHGFLILPGMSIKDIFGLGTFETCKLHTKSLIWQHNFISVAKKDIWL